MTDDTPNKQRASNGEGPARREDYRSARVGAVAALIAVVVFILVVDAFSAEYEANPVIILGILGVATALVGVVLDPRSK